MPNSCLQTILEDELLESLLYERIIFITKVIHLWAEKINSLIVAFTWYNRACCRIHRAVLLSPEEVLHL